MNKIQSLQHQFVDSVPKEIDAGVLYVSMKYSTASHLCCCGCGQRVVTPISPAGWEFSYNGKTVSLSPSIGNWSFECQSHYWIRRGRIKWSGSMTPEQIEMVRQRDQVSVENLFNPKPDFNRDNPNYEQCSVEAPQSTKILERLWTWMVGQFR